MKEVMRIVFTNWINALTVYSCIFLALFIGDLIPGISTIKEALYNTFGSLIVYYLHFWLGFTLLIALLVLYYSALIEGHDIQIIN
jgi:Ni,Fe-hydrogenase I cytochrome b subunit